MEQISASIRVVAIDLAKRVFQAAGENARGEVIFEERYQSREEFAALLHSLPTLRRHGSAHLVPMPHR